MNQPIRKIILAGGGSGGPIFPLLAVAKEIRKIEPAASFVFVGTNSAQDKELAQSAGFDFVPIPAAKFRRYLAISNITDIFVFIYSLIKARQILKQHQPDLIFSAGGFVAVPLVWVARRMKIKVAIHQQDAEIGLANKLCTPFADLITTAFERTSKDFFSGSGIERKNLKPAAVWIGNPVREEFFTPISPNAKQKFGLDDSLPILLIFGGATGALQLNEVVGMCLPELVKTHQVIHLTGKGKNLSTYKNRNYHPFEFIAGDMADALKVADIVICRAGLSTIAELSALSKVAIVVPMPDSHQEQNAAILKERAAAVVLNKSEFDPESLPRIVTSLKFNVARQQLLKANIKALMPHDAAKKIAELILHVGK